MSLAMLVPFRRSFAVRILVLIMLLMAAMLPLSAAHANNVVADFSTKLQPGVLHGFVLGPSSMDRGYLAEITPMAPGINGETIEKCVIEPEFNGTQWNDVLRVQLGAGYPSLPVNIRVYDTMGLLVHLNANTTLQPGVWHGFGLGASSDVNGYLTEISPTGLGTDGETIERYVVQPEFNGANWNDVLRAQVSAAYPPLDVNLRVYETSSLPVAAEFVTTLQPGVWQGSLLGPSNLDGGYLAEITPLQAGADGETVRRYVVQPEFDGVQWNDVLRLQIDPTDPAFLANVRVYRFACNATPAHSVTWGAVKSRYR